MRSAYFYVVNERPIGNSEIFVAEIDGVKTTTVYSFLREIAKAFKFPDYFGNNYNALDECLNDLAWIDMPSYILYIENYESFLKDEDRQTRLDTLLLFEDVCNQWANVPNFEGEDQFRRISSFAIHIQKCESIQRDLEWLESH